MKASEHLGKMLERINQTHWGKGSFVIERGEHPKLCVLGLMHWTAVGDSAMDDLTGDDEMDFEMYAAYSYLRNTIDEEPLPEDLRDSEYDDGTWSDDVVDFNDALVTTREDVARVVEKAMVLAKESGD